MKINGQGQASPGSDPIHDTSKHGLTERVSDAKRDYDICVVCIGPVIFNFQIWSEQRKRLPIDIVDDRGG